MDETHEQVGGEHDWLDAPWDLLEQGSAEDVLALLAQFERGGERHPEHAPLECLAQLDLGRLDLAERALGPRPSGDQALHDGAIDAWLLARGELDLFAWRPAEARTSFLELDASGASINTYLRLSLCADLLGDFAEGRTWLRRARELDPDRRGALRPLDDDAFERVIAEAVDELPPEFARRLEDVPVLVDPVPSLDGAPPEEIPPDALGLFRGFSDLELSIDGSSELPPAIHLYRNNLERRTGSIGELREEIRITLFHELGHLLGFDEDGVESMGLG